ncbi:PorT family protein [Mucilaginibacter robiniae]|uniref:PorT family protein n=1 Tax=Mucilaginibacter robiniae TaxID=2728022 RepID=A0A7L5E1J3_9SPHI|nr:outer membrane beta-barrel protein [Mucilaginibacter robiniae]QJD96901.1 PorT family protein [Mucilaginibacter robiniae]
MKRYLLTALVWATATGVFAQNTRTDTLKTRTDTVVKSSTDTVIVKTKRKGFKFTFATGDEARKIAANRHDTTKIKEVSKAPGFSWGLTFARFDLGLTTLIDNGSFNLSPQNNFLRYRSWKSSNVGFDLIQVGYRFNSAFRIYLSGGLDWTHIRLRENITILEDQPVLTYRQDNINYSKNRFTSSYIRIPLTFDWRSHDDNSGRRYHIDGGADIGILYNGRVKQVSDENGKEKFNDDYHFTKLRYGVFARVGYGFTGLFAKYYFNDVFQDSPAQKGLKNLSFGLTFGF